MDSFDEITINTTLNFEMTLKNEQFKEKMTLKNDQRGYNKDHREDKFISIIFDNFEV